MKIQKMIHTFRILSGVSGFLMFLLISSKVYAAIAEVKNIRKDSYSQYTRLTIEMNKLVPFRLIPDVEKQKLFLKIPDVILGKSLKKEIADKRVSVSLSSSETSGIIADINLKNSQLSFYYFTRTKPPRIIVDIKDSLRKKRIVESKPLIPPTKKKPEPEEEKEEREENNEIAENKKTDRKSKLSQKKLKEEKKIKSLYAEGLRLFAKKQYKGAIKTLVPIVKANPYHRYSKIAFYIIAESYFIQAKSDDKQISDALDAYRVAISRYPKNYRREMALYRMGVLYTKSKHNVEAKGTYQTLIDDYPKGKYASKALLARAEIFSTEKRFNEAYNELEKILFLYPFSPEVRKATFKIGDSYFWEKDYNKAVDIYGKAMKKWPSFPRTDPEVLYYIGESFYLTKRFDIAKDNFFNLVNIFPRSTLSPIALARLGDIYKNQGKNIQSLNLYSSALSLYPGENSVDSRVKMADLGVDKKVLEKKGKIFDYSFYDKPITAYKDTLQKYPDKDIAQNALLGIGNLLKKDKQYLAAFEKFKELVNKYPNVDIRKKGEQGFRDMFFELVNAYHSQKGFFPILILYYNNFEPLLTEIKNPKILYEVGDSYKELGFYDKALEFFKLIGANDKKNRFKQLMMVGRSEALYLKKEYDEAIVTLKGLIKLYPKGKYSNKAKKLLGDIFFSQKKPVQSYKVYADFIKREPKGEEAAQVYYMMGSVENMRKRYSQAVNLYRKAIRELKRPKSTDRQNSFIKEINYQIFYSLFRGGRYTEAIKTAKLLQRDFPDKEREKVLLYLTSESYRRTKKDPQSMKTLTQLVGMDDGLIRAVATEDIEYLEWKKKHKDLY